MSKLRTVPTFAIRSDIVASMEKNPAKILIVDDETDILEFLRYNLIKEGYQVFTAINGKEGLETALKIKPQLIVLDIMMPEMDGVETCQQMRAMPELNQSVITFLTARNEDYSQIAALDVGGDDYITKPIKPKVLISRIKALLRRPDRHTQADEAEEIIQIGDLVIDKQKVQVIRHGEAIDLARKEFELLNLLASRPGRVFTRDEIFARIWGADIIVGNRTIDVHIRKLREKIGEEYVKTVKGIGYKIEF